MTPISRPWAVFLILFSLYFSAHTLATENDTSCEKLVAEHPRLSSPKKAVFTGDDGRLYISNEAFVHGGQPVDTKKFRAPLLIETSEDVGAAQATKTVRNFLHNKKYYDAKISLESGAIENVYVQTMPFPIVPGVMAGHVQARFVFADGYEIQLIDPISGDILETVKDMIVSYEAALPIDGSYNFALGAVDSSPLVGRLVSGQQKHSEGPNRQFNQFQIPLSSSEMPELLNYYLDHSINIQMNLYYNTVIRNCTTTIFDGLDSLQRFQEKIASGSLSPFLTTLGGDPVIGPAVNALLDRFGRDLVQVQDMKDEYQGVLQNFGTPTVIEKEPFPFAPGAEQAPMSLLVMTEGSENLSPKQKQLLDSIVEDIINDLPETVNMLLASAFSMADDLKNSPQLIHAITSTITNKLNARLAGLKSSLPETPLNIKIHFTPYDTEGEGTDLSSSGLRARLPFDVQKIDLTNQNKKNILKSIEQNISNVDENVTEGIPAFLKNFAVNIELSRAESYVDTSILLGLQPLLKSLEITNDQVKLDEIEIPKPKANRPGFLKRAWSKLNPWAKDLKQPFVNSLLTHSQQLEQPLTNSATIQFGPEAKVEINNLGSGQIYIPKIAKNRYICWSGKHPHTPKLNGHLNVAPLSTDRWWKRAFNWFLKDRPVTMAITELEMNLEELKIETTKIRLGVLGLRCLDIESVNQQFGNEANAKLQQLIENIGDAELALP